MEDFEGSRCTPRLVELAIWADPPSLAMAGDPIATPLLNPYPRVRPPERIPGAMHSGLTAPRRRGERAVTASLQSAGSVTCGHAPAGPGYQKRHHGFAGGGRRVSGIRISTGSTNTRS